MWLLHGLEAACAKVPRVATLPPHSINVFRTVVANTGIAMSAHQALFLDT